MIELKDVVKAGVVLLLEYFVLFWLLDATQVPPLNKLSSGTLIILNTFACLLPLLTSLVLLGVGKTGKIIFSVGLVFPFALLFGSLIESAGFVGLGYIIVFGAITSAVLMGIGSVMSMASKDSGGVVLKRGEWLIYIAIAILIFVPYFAKLLLGS